MSSPKRHVFISLLFILKYAIMVVKSFYVVSPINSPTHFDDVIFVVVVDAVQLTKKVKES